MNGKEMSTATLTSKGQITLPQAVRRKLGVDTGDRVEFVEVAPGQFVLVPAVTDVRALRGIVGKPPRPLSVEAMAAIVRKRGAGR
jgi:AbrB family looped-hinge helix DNA binding protein